ncbi:MAG: EF-P lysine aminoacylase GenX [Alphaproteobacteria bacterium]|nr:EF-P lysine aminoacylase GenX [Alphaproteobacteria bacterium]
MAEQQPWWRPDVYARRRANLASRAKVTRALRAWFDSEGFIEVETPALQVSPGLEPHLKAFRTELHDPNAAGARTLYLHTSPEFAMKKLLVAGEPKIFQLTHAFRDGERSNSHHPEFTMLEWYRTQVDYRTLWRDCESLLGRALAQGGRGIFTHRGLESEPRQPWQYLTVAEAFARYAAIDLFATIADPGRSEARRLAAEATRIGVRVAASDSWDDVFFRVFLERIEPHLGHPAPTILYDYPISQAALARPSASNPQVAERMELYVCGLELANGFSELTEGATQRRRFEADVAAKRTLYGESYPIDEDFLAALEHGMPDAAGIALGVDRLIMLVTGAAAIDDVLWAPVAAVP